MSMGNSPSRCDKLKVPNKGWKLPERMRKDLGMPLGEMLSESTVISQLKGCDNVISVGDVVSLSLIQNGLVPHVTIYDCQTERSMMTTLERKVEEIAGIKVQVCNPAGMITLQMVREIEKAVTNPSPTKIRVEGEEDLAALVCAAVAPAGSCLVYGIPKKGMALVHITPEINSKAKEIIYQMEESI
jgi:GTP-dependent dephospho-CoA kinase